MSRHRAALLYMNGGTPMAKAKSSPWTKGMPSEPGYYAMSLTGREVQFVEVFIHQYYPEKINGVACPRPDGGHLSLYVEDVENAYFWRVAPPPPPE